MMEKSPITNPEYLERNPDALNDPDTLIQPAGQPIKQDASWLSLENAAEPAAREVYAGM
jgi:hypothetical protein